MQRWLLDTQLLVWPACRPDRRRRVHGSVVSLWEVAIKASLGRSDVRLDADALRQGLQREGLRELPISAEHGLAVGQLPWVHRDPFAQLLVVQARFEQLDLLTEDCTLCGYGEGVLWVGG